MSPALFLALCLGGVAIAVVTLYRVMLSLRVEEPKRPAKKLHVDKRLSDQAKHYAMLPETRS